MCLEEFGLQLFVLQRGNLVDYWKLNATEVFMGAKPCPGQAQPQQPPRLDLPAWGQLCWKVPGLGVVRRAAASWVAWTGAQVGDQVRD